ncbi:MAG: hypothetical protein IPN95_24840 [Bacteroidetes bacterium]|nr:hypothetical protein [Bacteroidota bacterium]
MRKSEVGFIAFNMRLGGQETIQLKIYRDGTLVRIGGGGLPPMAIGAASYWPENGFFDRLMEKMPQQLLLHDINYAEEVIERPLVYEMRLGGSSMNGLIGEQALWAEQRLIRFQLDLNTTFRSPVFAFVDSLMKDAIGLTNSWYFDTLILAIWGRRSNRLPRQTMVSKPEGDTDLKPELANFLSQMLHSPRKWNFLVFPDGKVFTDEEGTAHRLLFKIDDGRFNYVWV